MLGLLRVIDMINKYLKIVTAICLGIMAVTIITQVLSRYILGTSLYFSEELARYLMIYITFFGAAIALREQKLIAIEFFSEKSSEANRKILKTAVNSVGIIFFIILFVKGLEAMSMVKNQTSAGMQIPMSYVYAVIPTGSILLTLSAIAVLIEIHVVNKEVGN